MEWKKSCLTHRVLKIVRKSADSNELSYYTNCGSFAPDDDSYEPESRPVTIFSHHIDEEIIVSVHEIEKYSLQLRIELPPGTLDILGDWLDIGIIDRTGIHYINRRISAKEYADKLSETFYFEENKLKSYHGRPTKDYLIKKTIDGRKLITTELPGFINGIPNNRDSVTDLILNLHYESFKQLKPDISQSLEACLNELRK